MARLPDPGSDAGQWGTVLNEFLLVAHNSNGSAKASASADNVAALRARAGVANEMLQTLGYYAANDGGSATYIWNATSTTADDGGSVLAVSGVGTGRWQLVYAGAANARQFGAKGDGVTDDTQALQNGINFVVDKAGLFFMPNGVYKTTSRLTVGTDNPPSNPYGETSFCIRGAGMTFNPNTGNPAFTNGTQIRLYGTGHTGILEIRKGASRYAKFEEFSVVCDTKDGATHGFYWSQTYFSQHNLLRVHSHNTQRAFSILGGGGSNGEFTKFERCIGTASLSFFYMDAFSGQGYNHMLDHCLASVDDGGTYFEVGGSGGGYGLTSVEFSCSTPLGNFDTLTGTTFLKNSGLTGILNFIGGRNEGVSTVLYSVLGNLDMHGKIAFRGVSFDGMTSTQNRPVIKTTGENASYTCRFEDCLFDVLPQDAAKTEFSIKTGIAGDDTRYDFERCALGSFSNVRVQTSNSPLSQVIFADCYRKNTGSGRYVRFAKRYEYSASAALTDRVIRGEHVEQGYGTPSNLLVYPTFANSGTAAQSPWVHTGQGTFYDLAKYGETWQNFSASPQARTALFRENAGVYQDVTAAPFGTGDNAVYYQAAVSIRQGNGVAVKWSLENSVTGKVYDELIIYGQATDNLATPISLKAFDSSVGGYLRVRIQNLANQIVQVNIGWQLVSRKSNAAYVNGGATAREFTYPWSLNSDTVRAFGRLSLPLKDDTTGSAAASLPDLESDMYMSATTGRLKYYAGGKWREQPNVSYAAAAPTAGTWVRGDIVYSDAPSAGGVLGWICVSAGTPGTWKAMASIAS